MLDLYTVKGWQGSVVVSRHVEGVAVVGGTGTPSGGLPQSRSVMHSTTGGQERIEITSVAGIDAAELVVTAPANMQLRQLRKDRRNETGFSVGLREARLALEEWELKIRRGVIDLEMVPVLVEEEMVQFSRLSFDEDAVLVGTAPRVSLIVECFHMSGRDLTLRRLTQETSQRH